MKIYNQCLHPVAVPKLTGSAAVLRCGNCVNCVKQKKNELAVRTYREFIGQPFGFLTFTYSDDNCPVQVTEFNNVNGELTEVKSSVVRGSHTDFFQSASFEWRTNKSGKKSKRYNPLIKDTQDGFIASYYTVLFKDLQLALKRFRIKHPRRLQQFIAVPEYGSLTFRPHYHMLVLGLSEAELQDLAAEWPYGEVKVDDGKNPEKDNDVMKISQYVAKYCVKGHFDCPYISKGYCRKPRRAISKNYGIGCDFKELTDVLICKSELGITSPWLDVELSERQLSLLSSRRKFTINKDFDYVLPKYLVNKIFKKTIKAVTYEYNNSRKTALFAVPLSESDRRCYQAIKDYSRQHGSTVEVKYHQISSPLQSKVANYTLRCLINDARRELDKVKRTVKDVRTLNEYFDSKENQRKDIEERLSLNYQTALELNSLY